MWCETSEGIFFVLDGPEQPATHEWKGKYFVQPLLCCHCKFYHVLFLFFGFLCQRKKILVSLALNFSFYTILGDGYHKQ